MLGEPWGTLCLVRSEEHFFFRLAYGAMAQLVAHHTGSVGVRGSSPLSSTNTGPPLFSSESKGGLFRARFWAALPLGVLVPLAALLTGVIYAFRPGHWQ